MLRQLALSVLMLGLGAAGLSAAEEKSQAPGIGADTGEAPSAELAAKGTNTWSPSAKEGWRRWDVGDMLVKPGSALDFSRLVEPGPAGKHGFATVNSKGQLVFEQQPDKPLRLFCGTNCLEYWRPTTEEELVAFAEQVQLAGYNCYRPIFLDLMLMLDTTADLQPTEAQWKRWDILVRELGKRGIYLYVDVTTSWYAYYASRGKGWSWSAEGRAVNLYGRMYWDGAAREHWKKAAELLLNHVNPYTGLALKDNPQVVIFDLRNEASIHFLLKYANKDNRQVKGLLEPFREWLHQKYGSIEALNTAWGGAAYPSFDKVPWPILEGTAVPTADLQRFITDREVWLTEWMVGVMKDLGVRSLLSDFNAGVQFGQNLSRSILPVVDSHTYHDHPTAYVSPGSAINGRSISGDALAFVTWLNEVRQIDRPFIVSEWGAPYWNAWRYEGGLTAPAYGSFQGWQMLNHHAEGIQLTPRKSLRPFDTAIDPPGKLAERMSALLFARGDVAASKHTVVIEMDPAGIFERMGGQSYMPTALRRLALLVRSGLKIVDFPSTLPGAQVEADVRMKIHPTAPAIVCEDAGPESTTPTMEEVVAVLRAKGVLSAENRTSAPGGIYQSDTGELTIDSGRQTITVNTPRSQAAAQPQRIPAVRLADVTLENTGTSATFFVGALDDAPLAESRHLLLLAVGDALNSGSVFDSPQRKVMKELGTLPVLVKPTKGVVTLHRTLAEGDRAKLYALAFNGDRLTELAVRPTAGGLRLELDATSQPNPVFQYELVIESGVEVAQAGANP